ncbi:unnamed protein product [Amoebophrya sp. A25]|nr:unnamed protein product [Amoebophrya sp. A25]|eukprot:GSA25T00015226001.1
MKRGKNDNEAGSENGMLILMRKRFHRVNCICSTKICRLLFVRANE